MWLVFFAALANTIENIIYFDLTGNFPVHPHKGHQYNFVAYVYNKNARLIKGIPNKETTTQVKSFKDIYKYFVDRKFSN